MSQTITRTSTMTVIECCRCSMLFAFTEDYEERRRQDHASFYCPNGHSQSYTGPSDADKLRKQLEAERTRSEFWVAEEAKRKAELKTARAEATRLRTRANAGVCPCCNRSFVQLARHMKTKHPDHGA